MPYYEPGKMAEAVEGMASALRRAPVWVPEFETAEEFARRQGEWRRAHEEAIRDAENCENVKELCRLLSESRPYVR